MTAPYTEEEIAEAMRLYGADSKALSDVLHHMVATMEEPAVVKCLGASVAGWLIHRGTALDDDMAELVAAAFESGLVEFIAFKAAQDAARAAGSQARH